VGVGLSCLGIIASISLVVFLERSRRHRREVIWIVEGCAFAELEDQPWGPFRIDPEFDAEGNARWIEHGWKHVHPGPRWNDGHPDEGWESGSGEERIYDPDGVLRRQSTLVHRRLNGLSRYWDANGRLVARGRFAGDERVGTWLVWGPSVVPYVVRW
jgi:hypothetical protein